MQRITRNIYSSIIGAIMMLIGVAFLVVDFIELYEASWYHFTIAFVLGFLFLMNKNEILESVSKAIIRLKVGE